MRQSLRAVLAALLLWQGTAILPPVTLSAAAAPETEVRYLSGKGIDDAVNWQFFVTAGMQSGVWKTIPVPSNWELHGFGVYNYGGTFRDSANAPGGNSVNRPGFASEQGKYKLDFEVPASWHGRTVRLVFDGVMTKTEVWVNGQSAGPAHEGSFYRFKYDVTSLLKPGQRNLLEVTVSKVADNYSVNRAERQGDYWNFGGIFRPVFLEALPPAFIDWTGIDAKADGTFRADVHLGQAVSASTRVLAQVVDGSGRAVGAPFSATVGTGQSTVRLDSRIANVRTWTAETPNLYRVRLTLEQAGIPSHVVTETFGFRTFELRAGDGLYLNGQRVVLKGADRHSLWADSGRALSRTLNYDDVKLMKEMNMNAVRLSHYPPDVDFLTACDELGLYALDELAGWQGSYDTPTGQRLIGEMVRRDVNHPSVVFWDNGNEGGWNTANDGEFAKWDPQARTVLHPRELFNGVQTHHYPNYQDVVNYSAAPDVFMPTEILHGLYDGGLGAGFRDFWDVMSKDARIGGMFFWGFADEGIVRTDLDGRIDNSGDLGPDGILGPRREKEGSFYTIKEIWSPVTIDAAAFSPSAAAIRLPVTNHYDFRSLSSVRFEWALVRFPDAASGTSGHSVIEHSAIPAPAVPPHGQGTLTFSLPQGWARRGADALMLSATDGDGRLLWRWSWNVRSAPNVIADVPAIARAAGPAVTSRDDGDAVVISAGTRTLRFSRATGQLTSVTAGARTFPLAGPHAIAYAQTPPPARGNAAAPRARSFEDVAGSGRLVSFALTGAGTPHLEVRATYEGALEEVQWSISATSVSLRYRYRRDGPASLLGIGFDFPEAAVKGIRWLGRGPYPVWQNRPDGGVLDVWRNAYNDLVPSVTYSSSPPFKGFFRDWQWAVFDTADGSMTLRSIAAAPFLGVFTPKDGPVGALLNLPQTGLAVLDVIPAIRDKFLTTQNMGPQSAERTVSGEMTGQVSFEFGEE